MPADRHLRVLVAPDSFKGTFSSVVVAQALAEGWSTIRPRDDVALTPMADGGEGTLDAVEASGGWDRHPVAAKDPLMRTLTAAFLRSGDRAVVEMASASGLSRVSEAERDAMAATTFGTGQILAAAIGLGCRDLVIGFGGSATTDGGAGLLEALGVRFRGANGADLAPGGGALGELATVDLSGLPEVLSEVHLTVASDVTNPLLGEHGAAAVFGPQKGASPSAVAELDRNLRRYADVVEGALGRPLRYESGAGAAGGAIFGLLAIADRFASFEVRPGVEVVMELTGFDHAVGSADLVLTGEGKVDGQTSFGKTAMGVAERARSAGARTICFGGGVTPDGAEFMHGLGVVTMPVTEGPMTLEECLAAGTAPIARSAARAAGLIELAAELRA
ncbi:MAG: glycerate kinase [Chloroflexota bacterium]|jgi:glycerate kinase